jgi:hypothetical protein
MNQQVQEVHSAPPSSPPRFSKESQPDPIGDDGGGGGRYSASNYTYHRAYEHNASPLARAYSTESNDPAATTTTLSPHQLFSTPPSYQHDSRSDSYAGESGGGRGGPPPSFSSSAAAASSSSSSNTLKKSALRTWLRRHGADWAHHVLLERGCETIWEVQNQFRCVRVHVRLYMYYYVRRSYLYANVAVTSKRVNDRSMCINKLSLAHRSSIISPHIDVLTLFPLTQPHPLPPLMSTTARSPHRSMWEINALELPEPTRSCLIRLLGIPQYTWGEGKAGESEQRKEEVD